MIVVALWYGPFAGQRSCRSPLFGSSIFAEGYSSFKTWPSLSWPYIFLVSQFLRLYHTSLYNVAQSLSGTSAGIHAALAQLERVGYPTDNYDHLYSSLSIARSASPCFILHSRALKTFRCYRVISTVECIKHFTPPTDGNSGFPKLIDVSSCSFSPEQDTRTLTSII